MSETYWQGEADKLHAKWIKALTDLETLKAENERLRKAIIDSVEMHQRLREIESMEKKNEIGCLVDHSKVAQYLPKPNAAKEGRDAK